MRNAVEAREDGTGKLDGRVAVRHMDLMVADDAAKRARHWPGILPRPINSSIAGSEEV